jgi:hypothetical protein
MVVDPEDRRDAGPFDIVDDLGFDPHTPESETLISRFHTESDLCGTCHNLRNSLFTKERPAPASTSSTRWTRPAIPRWVSPKQSTYDEWVTSDYATMGVVRAAIRT